MTLPELFRQIGLLVGLPAAIVAGLSAVVLVIARDWRLVLFGYALLSVMLALLLSQVLPTEWALLQAIVGGLNGVMLYLSAVQLRGQRGSAVPPEARWPQMASLSSLRSLMVMLALVSFLLMREQITLPQVEPLMRDIVLWLGMMGLLGLALNQEPLHAGLALLMLLGAFNLLYFSLVQSRTLVALTGAGQVLLGLAIAYLVLAHGLDVATDREQGQ